NCPASKLVYNVGVTFIESLPNGKLARVALCYLEAEHEVTLLKYVLKGADMPVKEKESILKLLDASDVCTGLSLRMTKSNGLQKNGGV
ncbi:hypothetical protein ACHAW6_000962, partial [Cyclotella cf. meneghiniana]